MKTILSGWRKRTLSPRMVYSFPSSFPSVFPFPSSLRRPNGWEQFAFMPISSLDGLFYTLALAPTPAMTVIMAINPSSCQFATPEAQHLARCVCVCGANGRTINLHVDA